MSKEQPVTPVPDSVREKIRELTAPAVSGVGAGVRPAVSAPASLGGLALRLRTLGVFRSLLADPVLQKLLTYLDVRQNNAPLHACISAYGDFVAALYDAGAVSLAAYVHQVVARNDNAFARALGRGEQPADVLVQSAENDLRILQAVANLTPAALRDGLAWSGPLPEFEVTQVDLVSDYGKAQGQAAGD